MISAKNVPKETRELIVLLENAAGQKLTKEEIFQQKASFVYGSLSSSSTITREQVITHLREHDGE